MSVNLKLLDIISFTGLYEHGQVESPSANFLSYTGTDPGGIGGVQKWAHAPYKVNLTVISKKYCQLLTHLISFNEILKQIIRFFTKTSYFRII